MCSADAVCLAINYQSLGQTVCDIWGDSKLPKNVFVARSMDVESFWEHMLAALARANDASPLNDDATPPSDDVTPLNVDATPLTAASQPGAAGVGGAAASVARSVRQKR